MTPVVTGCVLNGYDRTIYNYDTISSKNGTKRRRIAVCSELSMRYASDSNVHLQNYKQGSAIVRMILSSGLFTLKSLCLLVVR